MNRTCEEESKYDFYKKHSDPSMGDITLMKSRTNDEVICCKEYIKNSKEQFAEAILEAQNRLRLNNKYLIDLKNYSTRVKNDFCSTFYSIKLFYEFQTNNLQKEIRHRRDKGQDFSSLELTHLLYNIVEACSYLQDQGRAHGDIRPSSIAVLQDGNAFKLIDRPETTVKALAYQQSLIYSGKDIYLPPNLWMALKKNNSKIVHSEYSTDVFSFGLCILEAGLKKPVSSIYTESGNYKQELDRLIGEFSKKYSDNPMLVTTLAKMLTLEESGRPDFKAIIKAIPPYAEVLEYFDQEDPYDDTFTSNNYGQDYADQYYDPNHQSNYGGYPQQPQYGAPAQPAGYGANQYGYQPNQPQYNQYGQPIQAQPVQPQAYGQFAGQNQMVSSNPVGYNQQPAQVGAFPQQG